MIISSNDYRQWHKDASRQIVGRPKKPIESCTVQITIFAPTRVKSDLSNKAESIMDLLVDNGIILDDNWFVVGLLVLNFGGIDKVNPRAEVWIQEVSPAKVT